MQKNTKGSIDADRRLMAKSRSCTTIIGIEPCPDGIIKRFDRTSYNDRQWHSLYVYCWQHKDDFDFEYRTAAGPAPMTEAQMAKVGIELEDDASIVRKNKVYSEEELRGLRIRELREICTAKAVPDDGDKKAMIDAILGAQGMLEE